MEIPLEKSTVNTPLPPPPLLQTEIRISSVEYSQMDYVSETEATTELIGGGNDV